MRKTFITACVTVLLTGCATSPPACNSPEVLAMLERIQMEGLRDIQNAAKEKAVEQALLPYKLMATLRSDSTDRMAQITDSAKKSFEAQYDASLPKLALTYSGVMTEKDPTGVSSICKAQVDLSLNGDKKHTEMSTYKARYTDDKKLYVEASKVNIEQ